MKQWRARVMSTLILVAMVASPGLAGKGDRSAKKEGGINPSSMTVIDDDFEMAMVALEPDPVLAQRPTGMGMVVAVLDGGFNLRHPAIADRISPFGYDAVDLDYDPHDTGNDRDDDGIDGADTAVGHGTFVAAMVLDVAPDATILPIRVRDDEGFGTNEELIRGIEYAVEAGADVINLSLEGASAKRKSVGQSLTRARDRGVLVVLSAGNDGVALKKDSMMNQAIVVGSVDANNQVASFSNYATGTNIGMLFLYAEGVELIGPMGDCDDQDSMGLGSGTSFSAGIVSGAAAAYRERHPECTVLDVVDALRRSTDPAFHAERGELPGGVLSVERLGCE